jgi:WD40 repeat protein
VVNTKEDAILLDDVSEGVALFKLSGAERIKTFPVPYTACWSRNVAFHDGTSSIVSGSDHGKVYIFDRRTGDTVDIIDIGAAERVQSIAVSHLEFVSAQVLTFSLDSGVSRRANNPHW